MLTYSRGPVTSLAWGPVGHYTSGRPLNPPLVLNVFGKWTEKVLKWRRQEERSWSWGNARASGLWGRSPQRGPGQRPWSGLQPFFGFGYPKGGGIFHLTSKFRKLRKPHIFQVTSD